MEETGSSCVANDATFTSISLGRNTDESSKREREPKRVIHFSDGVLEEYSSDEENVDTVPKEVVDPRSLTWLPWCTYYMSTIAHKSFSAAEFCGGKLAWLFGITTPKYRYAIEEYKRVQKEAEEEKARDRKSREECQGLATINVEGMEGKPSAQPNIQGEPPLHTESTLDKY